MVALNQLCTILSHIIISVMRAILVFFLIFSSVVLLFQVTRRRRLSLLIHLGCGLPGANNVFFLSKMLLFLVYRMCFKRSVLYRRNLLYSRDIPQTFVCASNKPWIKMHIREHRCIIIKVAIVCHKMKKNSRALVPN